MVDQARMVALETQIDTVMETLAEALYFLANESHVDFSKRQHPMLKLVTKLENLSARIEKRGLTR